MTTPLTIQKRIAKLNTRKQELLAKMDDIRHNPEVKNKDHKLRQLKQQVTAINKKIVELKP